MSEIRTFVSLVFRIKVYRFQTFHKCLKSEQKVQISDTILNKNVSEIRTVWKILFRLLRILG